MVVANNGYQREDLTRYPLVVTLAGVLLAGLLGALGWLVASVSDLKAGQDRLSYEIGGIRQDIADLQAGQERLFVEIADLKALVSSQPPTE